MQVVARTRFAPGFAGHIDREAKILSGSRNALSGAHEMCRRAILRCPRQRRRGTQALGDKHATTSIDAPHYCIKRRYQRRAPMRVCDRARDPVCAASVTQKVPFGAL